MLQVGRCSEAARVRRSNSEPSLPTPDPWFADQDLQDVGYRWGGEGLCMRARSHDDLGSRMAGRCLKGHILEAMGSIAQPKVGARAAPKALIGEKMWPRRHISSGIAIVRGAVGAAVCWILGGSIAAFVSTTCVRLAPLQQGGPRTHY